MMLHDADVSMPAKNAMSRRASCGHAVRTCKELYGRGEFSRLLGRRRAAFRSKISADTAAHIF